VAADRTEQPGPADFADPLTQRELLRAAVWIGLAAAVIMLWFLAQPLLLIFGGLVFAAILDGGTRLLGRVLPIGRGWRLLIVTLTGFALIAWTFYYAGATIGAQVETLRIVVQNQANNLLSWGRSVGIITGGNQMANLGQQLMGSLGKLTSAVGSALGAISSLAMIVVIGIFVALEPRLYERGFAWMLPMNRRERFYQTSQRMGFAMRRLMLGRMVGMVVEGVGTGVAAWAVGIPMAALIGIITGLLTFMPNIGAIISGVLLVLVGFSAGFDTGIWAIAIYLVVQTVDGYVIVPMVAKRAVDLAPALVLGAQLLFGALFGILGLALADPIVAMVKVLLEEKSEHAAEEAAAT
jgi:predicted PurR-regulated permease PerM